MRAGRHHRRCCALTFGSVWPSTNFWTGLDGLKPVGDTRRLCGPGLGSAQTGVVLSRLPVLAPSCRSLAEPPRGPGYVSLKLPPVASATVRRSPTNPLACGESLEKKEARPWRHHRQHRQHPGTVSDKQTNRRVSTTASEDRLEHRRRAISWARKQHLEQPVCSRRQGRRRTRRQGTAKRRRARSREGVVRSHNPPTDSPGSRR